MNPKKQVSSLGDFSQKSSFGEAFKAAHASGGSGHTFTYKNKLYTTECADGGDYRKTLDDRAVWQHNLHEFGHNINANLKDVSGGKLNLDRLPVYGRSTGWSSDVDRQREEYHRREAIKKSQK